MQEDIIPQNKEDLKLIEKLKSNDLAKMPPEKFVKKFINPFILLQILSVVRKANCQKAGLNQKRS